MATDLWMTPLLLIPAKALLLISTMNRYRQLQDGGWNGDTVRYAMMLIYAGILTDALTSLVGSIAGLVPLPEVAMILMVCTGILCLALASMLLLVDLLQEPGGQPG